MKNLKSAAIIIALLIPSAHCLAMGGEDEWQKESNGGSYSNNNNGNNSNSESLQKSTWDTVKETVREWKGSAESIPSRISDELNSYGNDGNSNSGGNRAYSK